MPVFSLQTVHVDSYKLNVTSQNLLVSSVFSLNVTAENPNKAVALSFDPCRFHVLSQGLVVGLIRIPEFHQPPLSKNVSVQTRVLFERVNGVFGIRILGDVRAQVRIFHITLPKIKVALDCDLSVSESKISVSHEVYSMRWSHKQMISVPLNSQTVSKKCSLAILIQFRRRRQPQPALFIFGDSLFDPGNNNYINTSTLDRADFSPYGRTFFHRPTGRFSDGRLISDFIAQHAKQPLIPPYLQPRNDDEKINNNYHGVNFASAGAGALPQTFQGLVIDLKTQLKYYKREVAQLSRKKGSAEAARISSTAVYFFSIGTNDYISPFLLNSSVLATYPRSRYVEMVIGNLSTVVRAIYRRGGRKFVFLNLGELGCLPGLRILKPEREGGGCLKEASDLAKQHNKALNKLLAKMEQKLQGFQYFVYDFKTSLAQKITHPYKYGFREGKKACCGTGRFNGIFSCGGKRPVKEFNLCENPSEFVFWDSYHLTEKAYKQMADQMWSIPPTEPNSLRKLFICY
ncbi:GDSL esterase/lipase 5 [Sesamum alatum]|uniref:GDSL esterase/lipase 5 n=1 Tax=Sesamum alatum TaxID=300844 RepID=A0AAE1YCC7_9LAMI|nr:GDSL esterase/lipase 5 [Sesamum alatum]